MFSQYFGSYLLKRKLISADQLKEVLERESSTRVKIGILAIDAGYMTGVEVNKVHDMQMKINMRFGEIAIQEGFITQQQVDELLSQQNKSHLTISQALVDMNLMSFDQIQTVLEEFKRDSGFNEKELEALKHNDIDTLIPVFFKDAEGKHIDLSKKYTALFIKTLIRFVSSDIKLEKAEIVQEHSFACISCQEIRGNGVLYTGITGDRQTLLPIANSFGRENCTTLDSIAIDSLKEFINTHNGLFISEEADDGLELDLETPVVKENNVMATAGFFIRIPFTLPSGSIYLVIAEGPVTFTTL